jgi:hypothetical protein
VTVYVEELSDLDDAELVAACRRLGRRSMYLPTIAEIRREIVEERLGLPSAGEAWQLCLDGRALEPGSPEVLRDAYKAIGGRWEFRHSTNPGAMRHQFERDYDARVEALVRRSVTANGCAPALERARERDALAAGGLSADVPSTPVERRMAFRWTHPFDDLDPPTDEEKRDAIRVLRDGPMQPDPRGDAIYAEAERIFAEGAA